MVILGIDPGYAIVGCGVIDYTGNRLRVLEHTAVTTPAGLDFCRRLELVFDGVTAIIERHRPSALAIEKLYFNQNITTGIPVAEARGCILLAAQRMGVPVYEYSPQQVKQGVTGYGKAEKRQVIEMTRMLLRLEKAPSPDDVADALAVAICHAHSSGSALGRLR